MKNDPIVQEVREARQKIFNNCNNDLEQLMNYLKEAEQQDKERVVSMGSFKDKRLEKANIY
jgi:hypothetical protein